MSLGVPSRPDAAPSVHRLIEESRPRAAQRLRGREAMAHSLAAVAFLAVAVCMAVLSAPQRELSLPNAAVLLLAYALASRIEFDDGAGYTVPTQLVFVPMLFELPLGAVPLFVAAGSLLGGLPDYVSRRTHPERAVLAIADAWHAVGPALVLLAAGSVAPAWSEWPIYVGALGAQFAFDFAATTAREWLALRVPPRLQPQLLGWVYLFDGALAPMGLLAAFATQHRPYLVLAVLPLGGILAMLARDRRARLAQALELSRAYRGTALLLGEVVEADDAYTGSHSRSVVTLALAVSDELGLDERQRWAVEFGALLHDIGKIHIPKEIINKPGPLTEHERALVETHTIKGQRMLEGIGGVLADIGHVVRSSHERHDGLGYPDGLRGELIPIEARIVTCCDAFSAMVTDRPYRNAIPLDEALGELEAHAGSQFDPQVVTVLVRVVRDASAHGVLDELIGKRDPRSVLESLVDADAAELRPDGAR